MDRVGVPWLRKAEKEAKPGRRRGGLAWARTSFGCVCPQTGGFPFGFQNQLKEGSQKGQPIGAAKISGGFGFGALGVSPSL